MVPRSGFCGGRSSPEPNQSIGQRSKLHLLRFQTREDAITTLAANCLDVGFEMLTVFHGASPDGEMFASNLSSRPWKDHLPAHISSVCGRSAIPGHWSNG